MSAIFYGKPIPRAQRLSPGIRHYRAAKKNQTKKIVNLHSLSRQTYTQTKFHVDTS